MLQALAIQTINAAFTDVLDPCDWNWYLPIRRSDSHPLLVKPPRQIIATRIFHHRSALSSGVLLLSQSDYQLYFALRSIWTRHRYLLRVNSLRVECIAVVFGFIRDCFKQKHAYVHAVQDVLQSGGSWWIQNALWGQVPDCFLCRWVLLMHRTERWSLTVRWAWRWICCNRFQTNEAAFGGAIGVENPNAPFSKADFLPTNVLFQLSAGAEIYLSEDQALSVVPEFGWQFAFEGDKQNEYFTHTGQSGIFCWDGSSLSLLRQ